MKYKFPDYVIKVLTMLNNKGFESVVVGGAIRDFILNIEPHDFDVATNASVEDICDIFKEYKIIETGLKHGTVTIHINHNPVEITTYRGKSNTLKEDLYLRDFTFNSMAMDKDYNLYDFYNGKIDLDNGLVRCNNEDTFIQDPLRILRAIRMSGKYKFDIEESTHKLMIKHKDLIVNVAKERIASELNYIMVYDGIFTLINDNKEIFFTLIPELKDTYSFKQNNPYHIYDLYNHILNVIANVSPILEVRLAALFHDLGKLKTYSKDADGIGHFYGHPVVSAKIARTTLKKYKYDNKTIDTVSKLVEFHELQLTNSKKSIRRLLNKFGKNNIDLLFDLRKGDILAQNPKFKDRLNDLDRMYKIAQEIIDSDECFSLKQLAINGNDLIGLGISNGATIGKVLEDCLNMIIEGKLINDKTSIIEYVKKEYINNL